MDKLLTDMDQKRSAEFPFLKIPTRLLSSLTSQLDLCHERLEKGGIEKGQPCLFCRDTYTDYVLRTRCG